jgi:hypothetical protein
MQYLPPPMYEQGNTVTEWLAERIAVLVDTRCRRIAINNTCHHVRRGAAGGIDLWYSAAVGLLASLALELLEGQVAELPLISRLQLRRYCPGIRFVPWLPGEHKLYCSLRKPRQNRLHIRDQLVRQIWRRNLISFYYSKPSIFFLFRGCSVQQGK